MLMRLLLLTLVATLGTLPLHAQQTRADSAQVLLDAARVLERQGQHSLSQQLLRVLRQRWPATPAGQLAGGPLTAQTDEPVSGLGRTGFIAYHTALGAWLGVAIPAALDANSPEPYGIGLLVGAPAGFIGSRLYADRQGLTDGQAGVITFASQFGMWQALGWSSVLGIGDRQVCPFPDYCYDQAPNRRPFTASIVGAVAGVATGALAASKGVAPGTSTMVSHSGYWGTWYGFAITVLTDPGEIGHRRLTGALVGSDLGVLLAIPLAKAWQPTTQRVRLVSAGGLAGGLAGVGVALLARAEDSRTVISLIGGGSVAGMTAAALLTRDRPGTAGGPVGGDLAPALLSVSDRTRLGIPAPMPTVIELKTRTSDGKTHVPGVRIPLIDVRF